MKLKKLTLLEINSLGNMILWLKGLGSRLQIGFIQFNSGMDLFNQGVKTTDTSNGTACRRFESYPDH